MALLDLIILSFIFIFIVYIRLPERVKHLQIRIELIRDLIEKNEGFFTILFIGIFALEQIALILLINYYKESLDVLRLIVGLFAVLVISTATLQKFLIDTKRRYEKDRDITARRARDLLLRLRRNRN